MKESAAKTIYFIDDNPIDCWILEMMMRNNSPDSEFRSFQTVSTALEYFNQNLTVLSTRNSLVFLDLHLPVYNGFDFLDSVKKSGLSKKLRINILTASVNPIDFDLLKKYQFIERTIAKPISTEKLNSILKN